MTDLRVGIGIDLHGETHGSPVAALGSHRFSAGVRLGLGKPPGFTRPLRPVRFADRRLRRRPEPGSARVAWTIGPPTYAGQSGFGRR
jgi:hypothetical protein